MKKSAIYVSLASLFMIVSGCYNPELPSSADAYFGKSADGIFNLTKAFMVEVYLGNFDQAESYLKEASSDRARLSDFAEQLQIDVRTFEAYYESSRILGSKPDLIQSSRTYDFQLFALKRKMGGGAKSCLYYVVGYECEKRYIGGIENIWWKGSFAAAKKQCRITYFNRLADRSEPPFPFQTNATTACFF